MYTVGEHVANNNFGAKMVFRMTVCDEVLRLFGLSCKPCTCVKRDYLPRAAFGLVQRHCAGCCTVPFDV